eukprot:CAMPEP_0202914780 /NCGR_PEP_ID=MMETSP1392-20130828/63965_1 /ASSEMBLY_ACC=CAM_ASM_000868 /TAXON_ID=225041 /ORGANISM="Chlamydomonas chlamydogama, Strain SAG 11-48b" /LENGTH=87 /DNA_ID=CAMNT_0049606575 /DNA_START=147 /DNA_END=410 /DNA_ORIENTATION=+
MASHWRASSSLRHACISSAPPSCTAAPVSVYGAAGAGAGAEVEAAAGAELPVVLAVAWGAAGPACCSRPTSSARLLPAASEYMGTLA